MSLKFYILHLNCVIELNEKMVVAWCSVTSAEFIFMASRLHTNVSHTSYCLFCNSLVHADCCVLSVSRINCVYYIWNGCVCAFYSVINLNPLTPNIKDQILLSCPHTFLIKYWGEVIKLRKLTLGDHILNSHDLRG